MNESLKRCIHSSNLRKAAPSEDIVTRDDRTYEERRKGRPPQLGIAITTVFKSHRQHSSFQVVSGFLSSEINSERKAVKYKYELDMRQAKILY